MKQKLSNLFLGLLAIGSASAQGLYYMGSDTQESLPLKFSVGTSVTYDDNINPGYVDGTGATVAEESSFGMGANVTMSYVNITPQTTWDVYVNLGLIYYFDAPTYMDDVSSQSRTGVNLTHRFNERLRFSSRNYISYELEPDYAYGYASSRAVGEYFYWQTDNSLGYRWSERVGTYTGLRLTGTTYQEEGNNDRLTWEIYNQFRYQLSPQTVLTGDYRYSQTSDPSGNVASDSADQYLLAGVEHRFSPNTIGIVRTGAQFRDVDQGSGTNSPYLEFALNSKPNQLLSYRTFLRYGIEGYDTVQSYDADGVAGRETVEFDDRRSLRFGISGTYALTHRMSLISGVDYIPTSYASGRVVKTGASVADREENIINANIGLSMQFTDMLSGNLSYNFTDSSSDFDGRSYNRNRITLGLNAQF